MMRVFGKRRFAPLDLQLLLCVVMTGCAQNPQAAKEPESDKRQAWFVQQDFRIE